MWKKTGAERVKSFRLYQELESEYSKALEEIERMGQELRRKDDLVKRLAAELAGAPTAPVSTFTPSEATLPMPFSEKMRKDEGPSTRNPTAPTLPVEGNGEETVETDELGHIRTTPKGTVRKTKP